MWFSYHADLDVAGAVGVAAVQAHGGGESVLLVQMAARVQPVECTESEKNGTLSVRKDADIATTDGRR